MCVLGANLAGGVDAGRVSDGHRVKNELFGYLTVHARENVAADDALDVGRGHLVRRARRLGGAVGGDGGGVGFHRLLVGAARLMAASRRLDLLFRFLVRVRALVLFARARGLMGERRRRAMRWAGKRVLCITIILTSRSLLMFTS